jgi:hypothetical protein
MNMSLKIVTFELETETKWIGTSLSSSLIIVIIIITIILMLLNLIAF